MAIDYATTPRVYLPGLPTETRYVRQIWQIANLIERSTRYYLTATHYGQVIDEMRAQYGAPATEPPKYLLFGVDPQLTVINAGTDSELEVNMLNEPWERLAKFQDRARVLRVR